MCTGWLIARAVLLEVKVCSTNLILCIPPTKTVPGLIRFSTVLFSKSLRFSYMGLIRHVILSRHTYKIRAESGDGVQVWLFCGCDTFLVCKLNEKKTLFYLDCCKCACIFKDWHAITMGSVHAQKTCLLSQTSSVVFRV